MYKPLLVLIMGLALAGQLLNAQPDPWRLWNLSPLQPGRELTVETFQPKRKVKGTFIAKDREAITIQLKSGTSETISRQNVRKVTAKRNAYNYAPLIGAAAGATTLGVLASRPRMDFSGTGKAMFAAIGAGIGALVGWAVRAAGNDELIYQAR
ncbi:MAG TPA: hypothetical protein VN428_15765 [Bryobacteraceae bacterium]|nr:hypothetical protein [Bryobacteraceae bacterium]